LTVLIATAVEAEADAVRAGSAGLFDVAAVGVGPAAAAAGTARLLAVAEAIGRPYQAVINAGVAGAFPGRAEIGATVIATRTIAADLGAETPAGFLPIEQLGFGTSTHESDPELFALLTKALPNALAGDVLTLSTVTGTASTAARLAATYPAALAEAMEGFGVATSAAAAGLPFIELRTTSNAIGPRDRHAWRLAEALTALTDATRALATHLRESR
jgi:futalosine hydrolase